MKRLNLTIYTAFLILALFSCKRSESMKSYIEKGFAKPTMGDAQFAENKLGIGDGGKLYVPSEEDIEVQFTIKNKYNQELTGTLEFDESKKELFSKVPEIKELIPTRLVVSFAFKADAEPKDVNNFLGESFDMTAKIFEKKSGRFLSSQRLATGCNTAPPAIKSDSITYKPETDEYVVTLPKNEGKHNDLKEVRFTLSSTYGKETVEPKVVSVLDVGNQGKQYTLKIEGNEAWQLKHPNGQRNIVAIVYDRAGLKSPENDKEKSKTKRYFTSITLLPSKVDASIKKAKAGVDIPKIKELEEFFNGGTWEQDGYSVKYEGLPHPTTHDKFEYDPTSGRFKNLNAKADTSYRVTVTLKQGSLYANDVSADYTIYVVGNNVAKIDESNLLVTDITQYPQGSGFSAIKFDNTSLNFEDGSGGVRTATVTVPYTGLNTKLKVKVVAISDECTGSDGNGPWNPRQYEKEYEIELGNNNADNRKELEFTITAPDGHTTKKYKILFVRGESVKVEVSFARGIALPAGSTAVVNMSWKYGKVEVPLTFDGSATSSQMTVAKNADVDFDITAGENIKVKKCESSINTHNTAGVAPKGGKLTLKAKENFTLTVTLVPEASVKWINYQASEAYTKGKITYTKVDGNRASDEITGNDLGRAVKKDSIVTFELENFKVQTHSIESWIVNGKHVTQTEDNFELSENKSILTIKKAQDNYEVEAVLRKTTRNLKVKIVGEKEGYSHNMVLTAQNISTSPNSSILLDHDDHNNNWSKDVPADVEIELSIVYRSKEKYGIDKWQIKKEGDNDFSNLGADAYVGNSEDKKIKVKIKMDRNVELRIFLIPKYTFKMTRIADADSGILDIYNSIQGLDGNLMTVNPGDGSKTLYTGDRLYYVVRGLDPSDVLVACKVNGNEAPFYIDEVTDMPNDGTGAKRQTLPLDPGDDFEIVIAKVKRLKFSVRDYWNNDNLYADNGYTLEIKQSEGNASENNLLFPKVKDGIKITHKKLAKITNKQYNVYVTDGTKIDIKMTKLADNKEIGVWKKWSDVFNSSDFNKDVDKPGISIGNMSVAGFEYDSIIYGEPLELNACIRGVTNILTLNMHEYKKNTNTGDASNIVKVSQVDDSRELLTVNGAQDLEHSVRIEKDKNIEIRWDRENNDSPFYFAEVRKKVSGQNNNEHKNYNNSIQFKMGGNTNVDLAWTKHLIVKIHPVNKDDLNSTNFPPWGTNFNNFGSYSFGKTKVKVELKDGRVHTNSNLLYNNEDGKNVFDQFLISDIKNSNVEHIELQFEGPSDKTVTTVCWKYAFDNLVENIYKTNDASAEWKPSPSALTVKFNDVKEPHAVLHLWLYQAK